jgi:predicted glycoside hydrolase/deacetylase ChbG (UPF0249 family)
VSKRLIVNADDFGRTPGVNRGIVEAHARGIVTSTTLMVNAPAAADAARLAKQHPELGVGLHLALTGGAPTLPPEQLSTLVDGRGRLPARPQGLAHAAPREILAEARAQLRRFHELMGAPPTHFDSHHHAHRLPSVLEALVTLSWETGLPVRNAGPEVKAVLDRERIATPDHFVDVFHDANATPEALVGILAELLPGTSELMCHPALVDDALRAGSSYAEPRGRELEALSHPEARATLHGSGVRLIDFSAL